MPDMTRKCSFCGNTLEPGTGQMYVKKDGTILYFDANKCYKNMIELKRVARTTLWTEKAHAEKTTKLRNLERAEAEAAAERAAAEPAAIPEPEPAPEEPPVEEPPVEEPLEEEPLEEESEEAPAEEDEE